ncbi:MAG: hypothetical protein FWG02_07695 [Holophagaceae bacterium]|nr:hypothetical protein [Holophagaceae bacterium]
MAVNAAQINNYMGYTTAERVPSQDMDKEAFMKLLVAQLQNQDPTDQNDPMAMVQQMTAFSQLEQLENLGSHLMAIQDQNVALFQSQATNLVGKTVRVNGAGTELKKGEDGHMVAKVGLDLATAATVTMIVRDENGLKVATIDKGGFEKGHHEFEWNGLTESGAQLKAGTYTIEFNAFDENGEQVNAASVSDLRVDSVAFAEGTVLIVAGGKYYSLGDIIEVTG